MNAQQEQDQTKAQGSAAGSADLAAEAVAYLTSFRRRHPVIWALTLFGPLVVTGLALGGLWWFRGGDYVAMLVGKGVVTFFALGRFVILSGRDGAEATGLSPFTRGELFAMVTWMDACVASLLVYHSGFIYRIPWLGARLAALQEDGEFILSMHPWMRRLAFAGLMVFVMVPIAATGSIGGAIFGRLLGMARRAVFLGIVLGSVAGNALMYYAAGLVTRHFGRDNPMHTLLGIGVIVAIVVLLNLRYQRMKKTARDQRPPRPPGPAGRAGASGPSKPPGPPETG